MPECVTPWTTYLAVGVVMVGSLLMVALVAYMQRLNRSLERRGKQTLRDMDDLLTRSRRAGL